jgi:hypothetical protein
MTSILSNRDIEDHEKIRGHIAKLNDNTIIYRKNIILNALNDVVVPIQ